jgi:hypothetical protein
VILVSSGPSNARTDRENKTKGLAGSKIVLQSGKSIKIKGKKNAGIIFFATNKDKNQTNILVRPFLKGKEVAKDSRVGKWFDLIIPGEQCIIGYPYQSADEIKITVETGMCEVEIMYSHLKNNRIVFPENRALGRLPGIRTMNCDQERVYKFDRMINSKEDFVDFLKILLKGHIYHYSLDSFKTRKKWTGNMNVEGKPVFWDLVLNSVKISSIGSRTLFSLSYYKNGCMFSKQQLKATSDGFFSFSGCCGK